jgi:hypothetical protein
MSDRVVQLAGQLVALVQPHLLDLAVVAAGEPKVLRRSRPCGQDSWSPQAEVSPVSARHGEDLG